MGSAKARPFQLEQKYKLKNLGKKGPRVRMGHAGGGEQHKGPREMEVGTERQEKGQKGS